MIAVAVADQRSRVPQNSVRSKITEILARQGRPAFFSDRAPPATYRTTSQPTSCPRKTRAVPSRRETPLVARGSFEQFGVMRSSAPHTLLIRAPQESRPLLLTAENCVRSPAIRLATRFARGTEVTAGNEFLRKGDEETVVFRTTEPAKEGES